MGVWSINHNTDPAHLQNRCTSHLPALLYTMYIIYKLAIHYEMDVLQTVYNYGYI